MSLLPKLDFHSTGEEMKHKRRILIDRITAETGHMDPAFSEMLTAGEYF